MFGQAGYPLTYISDGAWGMDGASYAYEAAFLLIGRPNT